MDFNAPLNPKMASIIFFVALFAGLMIKQNLKIIIGGFIAIGVATVLFIIVSQNPYIYLDPEVTQRILDKFYYSWKDKPKELWSVIIHTPIAAINWSATYKPLIGLVGFAVGFAVLGKYFAPPPPPPPKK
jgi:cell division protein FtsW (lipid II flippase)